MLFGQRKGAAVLHYGIWIWIGIGVQQPKSTSGNIYEQQGRQWCNFSEDCTRVPNCPFLHSTQDFPALPKRNRPPFGARRMAEA